MNKFGGLFCNNEIKAGKQARRRAKAFSITLICMCSQSKQPNTDRQSSLLRIFAHLRHTSENLHSQEKYLPYPLGPAAFPGWSSANFLVDKGTPLPSYTVPQRRVPWIIEVWYRMPRMLTGLVFYKCHVRCRRFWNLATIVICYYYVYLIERCTDFFQYFH